VTATQGQDERQPEGHGRQQHELGKQADGRPLRRPDDPAEVVEPAVQRHAEHHQADDDVERRQRAR